MKTLFKFSLIIGTLFISQESETSNVSKVINDFTPIIKRATVSLAEEPWEKIYPKSPYGKVIVKDLINENKPEVIVFGLSPLENVGHLHSLRNYFTFGIRVRPSILLVSPREGSYLEDVAQKLSMSNLVCLTDECALTEDILEVDRSQPPEESRAYILNKDGKVVDYEPSGYLSSAAIFGRWMHNSLIEGKH